MRITTLIVFLLAIAQQPDPGITLRARIVLDGKGQILRNTVVSVRDGQIIRVGGTSGDVTYDLGTLTLMPGMIDTHVHIGWHFDTTGRYHSGPEPPEQAALY